MSEDARFEEGGDRPLRLAAFDAEDLGAISALLQDAVLPVSEMAWQKGARRFALLANRFRWELSEAALRREGPERIRSMLVVENVLGVQVQGIDRADPDQILSVLSLSWEETDAPSGHIVLTLAGDGAIRIEVEALECLLRDVTRPYRAPSGARPRHPE
ncbi:DUF2948 family protein [Mesobaculum littorinae]|uniref:DUF2948 family protein n=1 Tax=Mesobaculum littorinae TaxID=2486419 RepID=A0A438AMN4_9RHOB|nr:DUF2948 family protein [Mesobaculum littorinae]RVV99924.1 DUF2948 family protein [Mesobaculum littorinae]